MTYTVTLRTFFRSSGETDLTMGPEHYLAGFESEDGEQWGAAVPLEPNDVESVVLHGIVFSLSMETNGTLHIEAEGHGDLVNEAIAASGESARSPLDIVVKNALQPDLLAMEDDALGELIVLRGRLSNALALVEGAMRNVER